MPSNATSLTYIHDTIPGYSRLEKNNVFIYIDQNGKIINDSKTLNRIQQLNIPPAWQDVWISPITNSHLQVTGKDDKKRKQYIYHPDWTSYMQANKFHKLLDFSNSLIPIRKRIQKDMATTSLSEKKILATIVWLLDNTYIRIGNEEYAKENKHLGLTTFRDENAKVKGTDVQFHFVGKSGKTHTVEIHHPRVASTIRKLEELPGFELFQYVDEQGKTHPITSNIVNEYLKEVGKDNISAKDFRTWGATVLAGQTLYHTYPQFSTKTQLKKNLSATTKEVARHLRNTPTVSRKYYIHPKVFDAYQNRVIIPLFDTFHQKASNKFFTKDEIAIKKLLEE